MQPSSRGGSGGALAGGGNAPVSGASGGANVGGTSAGSSSVGGARGGSAGNGGSGEEGGEASGAASGAGAANEPGGFVPYAQSGARIVARGYTGEGVTVFSTLRDEQLGFDCAFGRGESGALHCAPTQRTTLLYLDAECSEPAAQERSRWAVDAGASFTQPGDWVRVVDAFGAPFAPEQPEEIPAHGPIFRVGEKVLEGGYYDVDALPYVYAWDAAEQACVSTLPGFRNRIESVYRLEPVAETELVSAEIREIELEGGLLLERIAASDGAEISAGLSLDGKRCALQADGRCVPLPLGEPSFFADAHCQERAFELRTRVADGQPVYGVVELAAEPARVYELAPASAGEELVVYDTDGEPGDCVAVTLSAEEAVRIYVRAREITGELPVLGELTFGTARLRPAWFVGTESATRATVVARFATPAPASSSSLMYIGMDDGTSCWVLGGEAPVCQLDSGANGESIALTETEF